MAITYKTVLAEAVRGYNNIQNALAVNSSVTGVDLNTISKSSNTVSNTATASKMVTEIGKLTALAALGSITSNTADVSVYTTDGTNAGVNISSIVGTKATTEPTSGYYLAFTGSGSGGKAQISTAGFAPTSLSANVGVTSKTKYFPITAAAGSVSHTVSDDTTTSTSNAFTPVISKYTTDGSNAGINIQASTGTVTTNEPTSGYYVAVRSASQNAKKIVADASISTAGYIPTSYNFTADTKYVGLNASSVTYIPITSGAGSVTVNSPSVNPGSISTVNIPSSTDPDGHDGDSSSLGDIFDSLGSVTTTLPSTGYYLAVKSNSVTRTSVISADASIGTAGFMPTSYNFTAASGNVTINAGSNYYIPVTAGSCTVAGGGLTESGITTSSSNTSGISFTRAAITDAHTAGYIPTKTASTAIASSTKYITAFTLGSGKSLTSVTNNGTIATVSGTGTVTSQTGTQTITTNSGTVNIGTNSGTVSITTPSTGTVNYGEWKIKYNSTNKSLEFVY